MRFFYFFSFAANYNGVQHLVQEEGDDFDVAGLGSEVERRVSLGVGGVVPTDGFPFFNTLFLKNVCLTYSIFGMSSKSSSISIMPLPQRWLTGVCKNGPK